MVARVSCHGVARKGPFSLATFGSDIDLGASPSIDSAREALGGRVSTERGAGAIVKVAMRRGGDAEGVVVCVHGESRDVWIGEGRFVRTTADRITPTDDRPAHLETVADDARRFARLREGEPVRATKRDGTTVDGTLVEKCRYGALVAKDDHVLAVGFQRVAPAPS
jgi:hypothetical protein